MEILGADAIIPLASLSKKTLDVILTSTVVQDFVNTEYVSKLVKTIMTALTKNIVRMIYACPRYVRSIVIVALETNVLKKHVPSNVNQSMIVQMQRSVLTIFVLFLEGDHVMQNQVTSNFM